MLAGPRPTRLAGRSMAVAVALLAAAFAAGMLIGPADLTLTDIVGAVGERFGRAAALTDAQRAIFWEIRLPRVVLGGLVGGMLGLAGASYQGAFRNPLADPYLLGVAAGAGLGATLAIVALGPASALVPVFAFAGALGGVALTYVLGYSARVGRTATTLILAGVAIAAFLTALQTFVQQRNADSLRVVYTWILGRLSTVGWGEVRLALPYIVVAGLVLLAARRLLDVMALGDDEAGTLGLDVPTVRAIVIVAASLGTAAAVAVSGLIGFVGIIVPHTVRLVVGTSYRLVLPLSFVVGAAFLIGADLLARSLAAPVELPIGVITAFFGAPFFALVLRTSRETR